MTERIAIVGSRAHPNLDMVRAYANALSEDTIIITGGAKGVDAAAEAVAWDRHWAGLVWVPEVHHPDTVRTFGARNSRDRLLLRNTLIALDCDRMVVFPDGSRGGCWDAAREAVRFKRPVEVRWCSGKVEAFTGGRGR